MKTNEFDSRIKQGLEGLSPVFNEQDWIRLQTKMNTGVERSSGRSRYLLILLLLCAGLGVGVLAWSFSGSKSGISNNNRKQILASENSDFSENTTGGSSVTINESLVNGKINTSAETKQSNSYKKPNDSYSEVKFSELNNHNKSKNNKALSGTEIEMSTNATHGSVVEKENIALLNSRSSELIRITGTGESSKSIELSSIPSLMLTKIQSDKKRTNALNKLVKVKAGPEVSRWSAGIVGLVTRSHYSGGLAVQMAVNKNISLRTGLMNQQFFAQNYQDEQIFEDENDFEFTELAKPRHSKSSDFTNIRVNSADWVLPMELKFTQPLTFNSALYFSGGIQLTLKSKTALDFEYNAYDTNQQMNESDFEQASNNATLINNFILGAGWQYTLHRFQYHVGLVFQKNNSNLPLLAKKEIGLMAGLSYAF